MATTVKLDTETLTKLVSFYKGMEPEVQAKHTYSNPDGLMALYAEYQKTLTPEEKAEKGPRKEAQAKTYAVLLLTVSKDGERTFRIVGVGESKRGKGATDVASSELAAFMAVANTEKIMAEMEGASASVLRVEASEVSSILGIVG